MGTRRNRATWLRYGIAIASIAVALGLKLLLVPLLTRDAPVLLFFAAVMVSATFGGFGPGVLATILGAVCDGYFFMRPYSELRLDSVQQGLRLGLFMAEGVLISVICSRMRAARCEAEARAAEAHELEGQLLQTSEAEQRRIGHDLHDGLGQHLTGIGLLTRRLEERLTVEGSSEAAEAAKLCELSKQAVEWTRDLCRSLSPPALESQGLPEALRMLAANTENVCHVECSFDQSGTLAPLDLASRVHLYRIAQEAISNAVRHGHARHLKLRLEGDGDGDLQLKIADDGSGIGAKPPSESNGMGLRIMRYRAHMIGASIEVAPHEGGGTIVTCRHKRTDKSNANT